MADYKDSIWFEFKIDCVGFEPDLNVSLIKIWQDAAVKLHVNTPVDKFDFKDGILEVDFFDTRIWKIKFHDRVMDTDVCYMLDETTKWKRTFILSYITPLNNATANLYAVYSLDKIKAKLL